MKAVFAFAALAAALAVSGCAPESGTVVGKHYVPPSSWTEMQCTMRTAKGVCVVTVPVVHQDPAEWVLTLRDAGGEGDRQVPESAWERCPVGSTYPECSEVAR